LNPIDYSMWGLFIAREGVQNTHHRSGRTETTTKNEVGTLDQRQPFVSGVVGSSRSVMRVLCIFSRNNSTHCYQLDSNLATLEAIFTVG